MCAEGLELTAYPLDVTQRDQIERERDVKIAEIVSDYRLPRPGDEFACCVPGTAGYASEIPEDVKHPDVWVKCMNSPVWVRGHGGIAELPPGLPYPDPVAFTGWLSRTVGRAERTEVVLIGLTLDCCVLCTAQELSFRGYRVRFLVEAAMIGMALTNVS